MNNEIQALLSRIQELSDKGHGMELPLMADLIREAGEAVAACMVGNPESFPGLAMMLEGDDE